ncbi:MAG: peptidylprolyl isomerase [Geobacteraceae bacterium GWC2_55_20]|nr:MAG: peptidylprolyl isomerase [Geobacteraceae bacterium GWC2_55_20]OGU21116.1 MAG: peptidylprolyl isomerase [Geobacteraceae bacterium GWF2_54_21]HBA72183.1 peptidylprolyl isomerase [Geobacter sp.]HCE69506.1 peptidylprolyl isomerase [Geobacter sp.]
MKTITTVKLLTTALCAVALFGCKGGSPTGETGSAGKKTGKVMAEVNGGTITTGDFERELKNLPEYLKAMADTPQGRKEMLDTMVIRELILQQASKDGIDKGPEIEEKLQDLKKRLIVEAFLKKKVETESNVSDEDLKKFYEQNKDKFKTGEQIKASHILVKTEKEAKDILAQIKSGGNFEELAKKSSVDSSSAKGGDLGWFGKGSMVPAFEKAALALKEGQVSDVVKSDFGFHIIKLTGKRPAGIRPLEEVKEQIKGAIMPSRQQEVFQKIKEELKKTAKVTVKEDVLNEMGGKPEENKPADAAKPAAAPEKK